MNRIRLPSRLAPLLVLGSGLASATDAPILPLDAGTYVVASYPRCEEAPLAGVMAFDGRTFIGPHDSNCRTEVIDHEGATYRLRTGCRGDGAGKPAIPAETLLSVRIESYAAMTVTGPDGRATRYALCRGFH